MNLHEFQAKQQLARYGVPVPRGVTVTAADQVAAALAELGPPPWIVKAQVHSGGRGKAGGVVQAETRDEVAREVERLLGSRLVTRQTGPEGLPISTILLETPVASVRELYLAALVDRSARRVSVMASAAGGMDIEHVATTTPEAILVTHVSPAIGLLPWQARRLGYGLGLAAEEIRALRALMDGLYRLFLDSDATLLEINPLVLTAAGDLIALDAKMVLDDNALDRHADLLGLRDQSQEDPSEATARAHGLSYIRLDGNIGCMVNGAGLAMATMDLVQHHGGAPANFLDVGGGTTAERVAEAFKLILSDAKVEAVLINIFGGIVRCDLIASGIMQAVREVQVGVPVVARLEGTNADRALEMLAASDLPVITAASLSEAADKVVVAARRATGGGAR